MYNNAANKDRMAPSNMQKDANMQKANRAGSGPNNVYADKNGNVQRQTSQGWESRNNSGGWNSPSTSQNNLNRDAQARQNANRSSYNSSSRPSSSSYGGARSAPRGGGGGRGGRR
jgi:hypothetical protein